MAYQASTRQQDDTSFKCLLLWFVAGLCCISGACVAPARCEARKGDRQKQDNTNFKRLLLWFVAGLCCVSRARVAPGAQGRQAAAEQHKL